MGLMKNFSVPMQLAVFITTTQHSSHGPHVAIDI